MKLGDMATLSLGAAGSPKGSEESVIRPVACHRCRQRRSYCSKDRPKCTRCAAAGFECVYEEARKITINEAYLRELENKVSRLEAGQCVVQTDSGSSNPSEKAHGHNENDDHISLPEAFSELSTEISENPSSSFKGPAHSDHFLRSFRKASLQFDDGSLDCDTEFYDRAALPSRRLLNISHIRLPPVEIARQLFAAQYTYIGTIFSFVSPDSFELLLQEAYQRSLNIVDQDACLKYAKLLVILAFGKMYSVNQWIDYDGPPGFDYFTHVLQLLPDLHEQGSVLFVEALALVGLFMQNLNRRDASSLYIGSALRMAITLGLHQEPTLAGIDGESNEHRRRVWWSVYSLDRIHSAKSGNPITIQDEDIGVELPSRLSSEPEFCPAVVLRHYTKLSQINGQIMTSIYRRKPKSGSSLMAAVRSIVLALSQWQQELPDTLRFEPAKLNTSRESVSTLLYYSQCIHMTARPLLFHVVQARLKGGLTDKESDWRQGLTQTTINVIEMCVHAAKDTINMMMIAAQKNLVATYGYMDSDYAYSAAIVLVMVCVAFPTDEQNTESMNASLDLLRGISHRGNSHLAARYRLLAHLRAQFVPFAVDPSAGESRPGPSDVGGFDVPSMDQLALSTATFIPGTGSESMKASIKEPNSSQSICMASMSRNTTSYPTHSQPPPETFDFTLLNNPSLADGMFYDVDMTGPGCEDNQEFWEEAFANLAGDSANTLVESLEWSQAALDDYAGDEERIAQ
ncbi:fungal-specific transcription factor [Diaporthe sp. PMI_573]|nr:fungal-specific transcription factor [Diaporthaceae sp. PMI_573]